MTIYHFLYSIHQKSISQSREEDYTSVWTLGDVNNPGPLLWLPADAAAKSHQSCPTLCDPIDGSPPSSPVPGVLQARTLEWVAISFSNAWKWKVKVKLLSRVRILGTPWTVAYQPPPSKGFSRQEYWSGLLLPSPFWLPIIWKKQISWVLRKLTDLIIWTLFSWEVCIQRFISRNNTWLLNIFGQ